MKIYLAHQISGLSYDTVVNYFKDITKKLEGLGYTTLCPMTAKGYLRNEVKFKAHGYSDFPVSTNHAIFERDVWMVSNCDVMLADFSGSDKISIGMSMEIAIASYLKKHTIAVMEKENPHRHAFILEAADIVFESTDDAIVYLEMLAKGRIEQNGR